MRSVVLIAIPIVFLVALVWIVTALHRPLEASPACALGDCPFELTASSSGSAYTYPLTSRFFVVLDSTQYSPDQLSCAPAGILGGISDQPPVIAPLFADTFEGVATGTCMLRDGDFFAQITIVDLGAN